MHQLRGLVRRASLSDLYALERRVLPHSVSTCFVPVSLVDCDGSSVSLDVLHPSAFLQMLADLPRPEALAHIREAASLLCAETRAAALNPAALPSLFAKGSARVAAAELRHRQALFLAKAEGRLAAPDDRLVEDIAARLLSTKSTNSTNSNSSNSNNTNSTNSTNSANSTNSTNSTNNDSAVESLALDVARFRGAVEALARQKERKGHAAAAIALASHEGLPAPGAACAAALSALVALERPGAVLAFLEQFAAKDEAAPAPATCATHLAARLRGALSVTERSPMGMEGSLKAACRFNVDPGAVFPTDVAAIQRWAAQFTHADMRPAERAAFVAEHIARKRIVPRRITVDALSHWCLTHLERQWLAGMLRTDDVDRTAGYDCVGAIDTETVQRAALAWALKDPKRSLVDNRFLQHYANLLSRGDVDPTHESFPHFLEECGECHGDGEMPAELRFVLPAPPVGVSLFSFLLSLAPHCSFWRAMLSTKQSSSSFAAAAAPLGHVCVTVQMPRTHVCVSAVRSLKHSIAPCDSFAVLHEDEDLLVLSKPPRLATSRHALCSSSSSTNTNTSSNNNNNSTISSSGNSDDSDGPSGGAVDLAALVMEWMELKKLKKLGEYGEYGECGECGVPRHGIVHRLDTETSGCVIVAKRAAAHDALRHQFGTSAACGEARGKTYLALCAALEPDLRRIALRGVLQDAANPRVTTAYRVLRLFTVSRVALVECRIAQGKKHQVRRHLAAIGLPVLQDVEHGGAACSSKAIGRVALHAVGITLVHPTSAEVMTFTAPLPKDFEEAMRLLA